MRILIDTNILIYREDYHIIPENLQELMQILNNMGAKICLHPKSVEDISRDTNEERKKVILSKINAYDLLASPPEPIKNKNFINAFGILSKPNDYVDSAMLYAVCKDAVDFLITEDQGVCNKAIKLNIKDRVLEIEEAIVIFKKFVCEERVSHPPAIKEEYVYNLNINDPFFNSLRTEYVEFENWFKKISREGRKCWVYYKKNRTIGALLIHKLEDESVDSEPPLPKRNRLKISTFKVEAKGHKIGELFIKMSVEYAIRNKLPEIYLTYFTKPSDDFVALITEYGFQKKARNKRGEGVFIKEIIPERGKLKSLLPRVEVSKSFWPNFYDGSDINKFIVPIRPEYHDRLFVEKRSQVTLFEGAGEFIVEGNTIKKAYLCHSKIKKISLGDILLFYRSRDKREIDSIGIVEEVHKGLKDKDKIMRVVAKRTVYPINEIEKIAKKPTMVILFRWHFYLNKPLKLNELKQMDVLKGAPQSITRISHKHYGKIKKKGGIDERFTVN